MLKGHVALTPNCTGPRKVLAERHRSRPIFSIVANIRLPYVDRALHEYTDMNIFMDIFMNITDMNTGFFHG